MYKRKIKKDNMGKVSEPGVFASPYFPLFELNRNNYSSDQKKPGFSRSEYI